MAVSSPPRRRTTERARSSQRSAVGAFHFDGVAPGTYELRAHFQGFKDLSSRVRVGSRAPSPQKLVLGLASIAQDVTVSNAAAGVNASASGNQDTVTLELSPSEFPKGEHIILESLREILAFLRKETDKQSDHVRDYDQSFQFAPATG